MKYIPALLLLIPVVAAAQTITDVSGSYTTGDTITIEGVSFGTKSPAEPFLWADFEGSMNPNSLGTSSAWSFTQNFEYDSDEGIHSSGCAKAKWPRDQYWDWPGSPGPGGEDDDYAEAWVLEVTAGFYFNEYGDNIYQSYKIKCDTDAINDSKMWHLENTPYTCESYINQGKSGAAAGNTCTPQTAAYLYAALYGSKDVWIDREIIIHANESNGSNDGSLQVYNDCVLKGEMPYYTYEWRYWRMRDSSGPDLDVAQVVREYWPYQGLPGPDPDPEAYYWVDNLYFDITWARVMIGDASTLSSCTVREPQPPITWSPTLITASFNAGDFDPDDEVYVFVVDSDGDASAGYGPITVGGEEAAPPEEITPVDTLRCVDYDP